MTRKFIVLSAAVILLHAVNGCRQTDKKSERARNMEQFVANVREERQKAGEPPPGDMQNEFWYRNAVLYNLDIEVFQDSDGDGTGDIRGLISRLRYLQSLHVDGIWLSPFQPTPNEDDGYDVSDFYSIDPRLGTMDDFKQLVREAGRRGIRILMDLVVNHTSDKHPWFVKGRPQNSPYHNWYVWSQKEPENRHEGMVFPGVQEDIWTYDSVAREYYYHLFYKFQPDLNMQNPEVQGEISKILNHWLDMGVAGFRLDGVPFIIEVPQTKGKVYPHQFYLLSQMRHVVQARRKDGVILGEANVLPGENKEFFGKQGGNGLHMMFNFFVNQRIFYALATQDAEELKKALEATKDIPQQSQWAQFLRNHDEVDLGRLTQQQRDQVYADMGPHINMQLYARGIRRRLAPMLHNDRKKLELAYSLLFSLPSTPVIRYGDETGMGDDLQLKERLAVRTPMQWSDSMDAGFSTAASTVRPVIDTGAFSYHRINVRTELADSNSLLGWTRRMILLRKSCPAIGWGNWKVLGTHSPHVIAIKYEWEGTTLITIHNLAKDAQRIHFSTGSPGRALHDLIAGTDLSTANDDHEMILDGYGYRWYRVQ